ncbi:MAG: protein kinase [Gemmataceae bacterium]|nr:protein kinase [Gemmataceae bacterium]
MPIPAGPHAASPAAQTQVASVPSDGDETVTLSADDAPAAPTFAPPAEPGEVGRLGPYRIVKELGRGGMGAVYAALDTRLDRQLALKVMLPQFAANPSAKERFLREARAAAKITHDNVVTVYEADERDGVPYIAMQFLQGYPLDEYLKKKGNPSIPQVLRIARETAAGLAAAHKIGLVHRDIKPGNLWLEAPHGRVKVLDFGLAKPVDAESELTRSGAVVGTPAYMSPEQARGEKVDHRTDLFSLGGVLYRLATGRLPFQGPTTMAVLMALGTEEPPPVRDLNPNVPESLADLIHQLLAKKADARPPSAADVVKRVRGIAEGTVMGQSAAALLQPQPTLVPISITALSEANPFAALDATEAEPIPMAASAEPTPVRKRPGGKTPWMFAGVAVLLAACMVGGVVIIIKNKDGTETKIEVPDGARVTIKGKDGKTLASVGPDGKPPAAATDPDRKGAEWVLSLGGTVRVNGEDRQLEAVAGLPKGRFALTGVYLYRNEAVTDAGLALFKDCKGLTHLDLRGTAVTDVGLALFKDRKKLTHLGLDYTKVTDAGLAHFKDCKGLTHLQLGNTAVTDAGLAHFKDCKGLVYLQLGNTAVTDAGLAHFKDCKELTHLGLDYHTKVTDAGLAHFKDCKGLVCLQLGNTAVTDAGLAHFKDHKGLTHLNLDHTRVTDAGLAHFKDCKGLTHLDLRGAAVTDAGLAHFKDHKGLTHLDLRGTAVTDAGLAHFKDCKNLGYLNLIETAVTDAGLASLQELKGLTTLDVRKAKVTAKGVAEFHAALPGCKIVHDGGVIEAKK